MVRVPKTTGDISPYFDENQQFANKRRKRNDGSPQSAIDIDDSTDELNADSSTILAAPVHESRLRGNCSINGNINSHPNRQADRGLEIRQRNDNPKNVGVQRNSNATKDIHDLEGELFTQNARKQRLLEDEQQQVSPIRQSSSDVLGNPHGRDTFSRSSGSTSLSLRACENVEGDSIDELQNDSAQPQQILLPKLTQSSAAVRKGLVARMTNGRSQTSQDFEAAITRTANDQKSNTPQRSSVRNKSGTSPLSQWHLKDLRVGPLGGAKMLDYLVEVNRKPKFIHILSNHSTMSLEDEPVTSIPIRLFLRIVRNEENAIIQLHLSDQGRSFGTKIFLQFNDIKQSTQFITAVQDVTPEIDIKMKPG